MESIRLREIPLVELFRYYGASSKCSAYAKLYSVLDQSLCKRKDTFRILEIGTASGASARALATRYPNAQIVTIDINPSCATIFSQHANITALTCDCSSEPELKQVLEAAGHGFDVVVDDGSHMSKDVIGAFKCIFPSLNKSWTYIIEDCDSIGNPGYSSWMQKKFGRKHSENDRSAFLGLVDQLMQASDYWENYRIEFGYCRKALWIKGVGPDAIASSSVVSGAVTDS